MFGMVLERLMIVDMQKISGTVERKITAVGVTKILCECTQMVDGPYARLWFVFYSIPLWGSCVLQSFG